MADFHSCYPETDDSLSSCINMANSTVVAVNPSVPFTVSIPEGLSPGRKIIISGLPNPNPSRFNVNLQCGPTDDADVAFHFDMRFNYGSAVKATVRNARIGGSWGPEERYQSNFPFAPNANFDIIIIAEKTCFKICVDKQQFTEFNYRIKPIDKIDFLNVRGDVRLTSVQVQ